MYDQILDQDDQLVILAGINDKPSPAQGPSNFPVSPPSGGQPSRPLSGVNPYRITPKVVDQGLGGAANPAGAGSGGGSAEFDETGSARQKQKIGEINSKHPSFYSNQNSKKQSSDQCELNENTPREINEKFESNSIKKLTNIALKDQDVKNEYDRIKRRLKEGVNPIDIGPKTAAVAKDKVLIKGAHGRYLIEVSGNEVNVLGIGARSNKKNMQTFEKLMNKMYDLNLQY